MEMTVPLDTRHDIREPDARGTPRAEMARRLGLSRNTVAKYAEMEDMPPAAPMSAARAHPALAGPEGWIESILEADLGAPRKRRHTAKRTCDRAVEERGCAGSYATVCRYVADWRASRPTPSDGYLELDWVPGTAQIDYGNFEAVVAGERRAPRLLAVTLPHSNARFCVACESQRSECLCDALHRIVERVGRAPAVLVPDDATEAGRRVRGKAAESALFSAFRAHYRCASRYRDPYSGNEKGSVENAVGFLRRNLPVPVPEAPSLAAPGRLDAEGGGEVGLAAAGGPVEDQVLGAPDEVERQHLLAAPPLREAHVRPVEAVHGLGDGEAGLAQEPRPLRELAGLQLAGQHPRAGREPAGRRGLEEPRHRRPG